MSTRAAARADMQSVFAKRARAVSWRLRKDHLTRSAVARAVEWVRITQYPCLRVQLSTIAPRGICILITRNCFLRLTTIRQVPYLHFVYLYSPCHLCFAYVYEFSQWRVDNTFSGVRSISASCPMARASEPPTDRLPFVSPPSSTPTADEEMSMSSGGKHEAICTRAMTEVGEEEFGKIDARVEKGSSRWCVVTVGGMGERKHLCSYFADQLTGHRSRPRCIFRSENGLGAHRWIAKRARGRWNERLYQLA